MIEFIVGVFLGFMITFSLMSCLNVSKQADTKIEEEYVSNLIKEMIEKEQTNEKVR